MIFFLRAFQGVSQTLQALAVPVDWSRLLSEVGLPTNLPMAPPSSRLAPSAMKSDTLHILVTEAGETKISLTFGAGAADSLASLVPIELRDKLHQRQIDLPAIAAEAQRTDYAPGELFALHDGAKTVRVWLD
jgi:hypothetical protein